MIKINNIYEWPFRRQLIVFVILFVILFYLGLVFDIFGLMTELSLAQQKETELKQEFERAEDKLINAKNEIVVYKNYTSDLGKWEETLVDYRNMPQTLNEILKLGQNNNLTFVLFDPAERVRAARYSKVPINVVAVGSYHQIALFFSQLANMNNIISIGKLTITTENKPDVLGVETAKTANAQGLLTAQFEIEIYYLDEATYLQELQLEIIKKREARKKGQTATPPPPATGGAH